jgi:hypothetical protein
LAKSCLNGKKNEIPLCSNIAPDAQYTCARQEKWGKCSEAWMSSFCCLTCHNCACGKPTKDEDDSSSGSDSGRGIGGDKGASGLVKVEADNLDTRTDHDPYKHHLIDMQNVQAEKILTLGDEREEGEPNHGHEQRNTDLDLALDIAMGQENVKRAAD